MRLSLETLRKDFMPLSEKGILSLNDEEREMTDIDGDESVLSAQNYPCQLCQCSNKSLQSRRLTGSIASLSINVDYSSFTVHRLSYYDLTIKCLKYLMTPGTFYTST